MAKPQMKEARPQELAAIMIDTIPSQMPGFYGALGYAIATWQSVELGLFEVFAKVATCRDEKIAAAIFYSINNFSDKLQMTHCAARLFLPDKSPLHDDWKKLLKALTDHSERRNALAHFRSFLHKTVGEPDAVVKLHPNYADPNEKFKDKGRKKTKMAMTTKDILMVKNGFDALSTKLNEFSAKIPERRAEGS